jgi:hypothetical protein
VDGIFLDEENVYWTTIDAAPSSLLVGRSKAGGATTALLSSLAGPDAVWTSVSGLYAWSGRSPTLYRVSMSEPPVAIKTTPEIAKACDAEYPHAGTPVRAWCQGGFALAPPVMGASRTGLLPEPSGIAAQGRLYVVENEESPDLYCPLSARLVSLVIASGERTILASGVVPEACATPSPLVLDEQNVYFTMPAGLFGIAHP